jgi:hypothetical protein
MTKEKPPSGEFDEAAFVAKAEVVFKDRARIRQALVLSQIENPIDVRAYEDYLHIDDEFLKRLDPYRESGFIDDIANSIANEYRATLASEDDKEFLTGYTLAEQTRIEELYETLKEHYGPISGPLTHLLEKEDLHDVRALAVWAKYARGGNAVAIAKNSLVRYLIKEYIREEVDIPPKLLLLVSKVQAVNLGEEVAHDELEIQKVKEQVSHYIEERRVREKSAQLEAGVHPKFAEKLAERKATGDFRQLAESLGELAPQKQEARHKYVEFVDDPRELVDVILDVKDGKLGGKL